MIEKANSKRRVSGFLAPARRGGLSARKRNGSDPVVKKSSMGRCRQTCPNSDPERCISNRPIPKLESLQLVENKSQATVLIAQFSRIHFGGLRLTEHTTD